jgi:hypothetical protein
LEIHPNSPGIQLQPAHPPFEYQAPFCLEFSRTYILTNGVLFFNSIIDVHDLIELDLSGRHFTWSNNRNPPTFEKLDMFFVSPEWDLHYNNMNVTGLSRSFSDHVPLCLKTDLISPTRRDFRYELCWKFRPDFKSLVVNNWSLPVRSKIGIDIWKEKVKRLKKLLKGWNINVEGRYLKLKKDLMEKIDILDKNVK